MKTIKRFGRWSVMHDGREDKQRGYYLCKNGVRQGGERGLEVYDAADQLAEQDEMKKNGDA